MLTTVGTAYASLYNDGGTYTISGPDGDVVIANGTTVNIVPGASIAPLLVYDPIGGTAVQVSGGSFVNVTGGSMTGGSSKVGGSGLSANGGYFDISGGTFQGGDGAGFTGAGGRDFAGAGASFGGWNTLSISGGNFFGGQGWAPNGTFGGDGVHIYSGLPNIANISGGTFAGGSPDGFGLHMTGMAIVNISGNFNGSAAFMDNSIGNLSGGQGSILSFNNAVLNLTEGHFDGNLNLHDMSAAQVGGGEFGPFVLHDNAVANFNGGHIRGTSTLTDNSTVNLTGGVLSGIEDFYMDQASVLNVFGVGLTLHAGLGPFWELQGTLQDGSPIDALLIRVGDNTIVNLIEIPEPSSVVLAAIGLVGLAARGWWRKR